jgi:hypothetical protein
MDVYSSLGMEWHTYFVVSGVLSCSRSVPLYLMLKEDQSSERGDFKNSENFQLSIINTITWLCYGSGG